MGSDNEPKVQWTHQWSHIELGGIGRLIELSIKHINLRSYQGDRQKLARGSGKIPGPARPLNTFSDFSLRATVESFYGSCKMGTSLRQLLRPRICYKQRPLALIQRLG